MLLGARQFFSRKPAPAWTNPYVTDGLVAMWDGEWNAGGGVHDASATTWKDLVGNNDLEIYGTVSDYGVSNQGKYCAALKSGAIDNIASIEVCHDFAGGRVEYAIIACSGAIDTTRMGLVHYGNSRAFQTYSNVFWDFPNIQAAMHSTVSATTSGCYVGGVALQPASHGTDAWNNPSVVGIGGRASSGAYNFIATYNCIRFYNRALTAAEIAANYAIDKARFNLP